MLRNYLLIALRTLRKHPGYTFINVGGLAVGLACGLFILLFVRHELSYDCFHEKAERIVRVGMTWVIDETELPVAPTTTKPGPWLTETLPSVTDYVRLRKRNTTLVQAGEQVFKETGLVYADSSLFDIFSFPLLRGDASTALTRPHTLVLTESQAQKYFGEANPVGQTLLLNDRPFEVTGVMADVPANSHLQFDLVASFASLSAAREPNWNRSAYHTYLLLTGSDAVQQVRTALPGLLRDSFDGHPNTPKLHITPLTEVYLHGDLAGEWSPEGDARVVYMFSVIAVLILLIACINYMNLATARSANRAKEVGVRKALGAARRQLIGQFMGEAVLIIGAALVVAFALTQVLLPLFNTLAGKALVWDLPSLIGWLAGAGLIVSLLAGSYPAFVLSRFRPMRVLKGQHHGATSGTWLRKGLVIFQFAVSVFLIASTFIIYNQLHFIENKELGYEKSHVVVVPVDRALRAQLDTFEQELAAQHSVTRVASASHMPVRGVAARMFNAGTDEADRQLMNTLEVKPDFVELLGLEMRSGAAFTEADLHARYTDDRQCSVLLNEAGARHFGWTPEEAVTQTLFAASMGGMRCLVKGVVRDFHYDSLHKPIEPLVIVAGRSVYHVFARTQPGDVREALADVEATWTEFLPERPFEYQFLDAEFDAVYRSEQRVGRLFTIFSILAVWVACLGLLGLAAFAATQRTKEIGVRKVLGASIASIIGLLSKDFLKLVVLGILIAVPLAYYAAEHWLSDFAYRITLGPGTFALAGTLALVVALLTVSYHALRAALIDPAESLRYE